jgi:SAM-dependent methyltransferase
VAEAGAAAAFLTARARDGPALELGIGTGRLALPLAAGGVAVHGIDLSEPMVARLRAKPGGEAVGVTIGDFADVGRLVAGPFALVFVAFNTLFELASQDDQLRCVEGVAAVLAPGGAFVVEAFVPDLTRLEQSVAATHVGTDEVVLNASRHDPLTQQVRGHDIVVVDGRVVLEPWSIRYATVPELDLMARLAGLRLRERHGGWSGEPFTAASTRHVSVYMP